MPLKLSPAGRAATFKPTHVERFRVTDRDAWMKRREADVTASVIGALLGVHEYETAYSLWAKKTGALQPDAEETAAMERGTLLEPVAAELLRRRQPTWQIEYPVGYYYRDAAARIGCTPDVFAVDENPGFINCQVKSVEASVFRRKWIDPDTKEINPPLWIAVQSMIEAHLTGASRAVVLPLVVGHGLDMPIVEVPIHEGVIERLRGEVEAFWRSVETGVAPDPDLTRDGSLLEQMWTGAGPEIDLSSSNELPALADEREKLSAEKSAAERRLKDIKTELMAALGNAARGRLADGRIVEAKRISRKAYSVDATSYVNVSVKHERRMAAE